uniref:P protein n=1 Tax=Zeugodacus cucurbitae sigmavirus-A3 TaxID=3159478 RepID=A0AAU7L1F9_9RHAB
MADKRFNPLPKLDPEVTEKLISAQKKNVFADLEVLDDDLSVETQEPNRTSKIRCTKDGCDISDQCKGIHGGFLDLLPDNPESPDEDWERSGAEGAQFVKPLSDTFVSAIPEKKIHYVDLGCGLTSCQEEHLTKEIWKLIQGLSINLSPKSIIIKRRDGEHAEDKIPSSSGHNHNKNHYEKRCPTLQETERTPSSSTQSPISKPTTSPSESGSKLLCHDANDEPGVLLRFRKGFLLNPLNKSRKIRRFDLNTPGFGLEDIKQEFGSIHNIPEDDGKFLVTMLKRNKILNLVLMRYNIDNICLAE